MKTTICMVIAGLFFSLLLPGGAAFPDQVPFAGAKVWGGSGADAAQKVVTDRAGNVYVAGTFSGTVDFDPGSGVSLGVSQGKEDVFLSKLDPNGSFQWVRTWGGIGRDVPNGLGVDEGGNISISGPFQNTVDFNPDPLLTDLHTSNAGGMNNIFLSQFDSNGNFKWAKTWGPADAGAESYSLAVDGSGHIYVQGDFAGSTTNFNPWDPAHPDIHTNHTGPLASFDAFLIKFDRGGNFMWAQTWGGEGYDDGPGVAVDGLGNVYVGGMYASLNINFDPAGGSAGANHPAHDTGFVVDVFLSKFDADGHFQWVRTWGGQGTDEAGQKVLVDRLNNVYITGRFECVQCDFDPGDGADLHSSHGDHDAFLSKFDPNGNFLWARTWGGTGWDASGGLYVDQANAVWISGMFNNRVTFAPGAANTISSQGSRDVFLIRLDASGTFQWVKAWGGSGDDWGMDVTGVEGGRVVVVSGSFASITDLDPGRGVENHTANGDRDAFLSKFVDWSRPDVVFMPLALR